MNKYQALIFASSLSILRAMDLCSPAPSSRKDSSSISKSWVILSLSTILLILTRSSSLLTDSLETFSCSKLATSFLASYSTFSLGMNFYWSFMDQNRGAIDSMSESPKLMVTYSFSNEVRPIRSLQKRNGLLKLQAAILKFSESLLILVPMDRMMG